MEGILHQAEQSEKKYDWLSATESYEKALGLLSRNDFSQRGVIAERLGYAFYRFAFQAETCEQFRKRMQSSVDHYSNGAKFFGISKENYPLFNNCQAMANYAKSWLTSDPSKKRETLNESWKFAKEALKQYGKTTDELSLGKMCNNVMILLTDRLNLEWDAESRDKVIEEALQCGEKAIDIFSKAQERRQLAQAYISTAYFCRNAAFARGLKSERKEEYKQRALNYGQKAIESSESTDDEYLIGLSHLCLADARLDILGSSGLPERPHYETALHSGKLTKDNLMMANALFSFQYMTNTHAKAQEDPDKAREEYRKLDGYWEAAFHHYSLASCDSGIALAYVQLITTIMDRSRRESIIENRHSLLEKSVELGYKGLEHARLSGSMGVTMHVTSGLGTAVYTLSRIETDLGRKMSLLSDSIILAEQTIGILERASAVSLVEPREINLALDIWQLARRQAELAKDEVDIQVKIDLLEKAAANIRRARDQWLTWVRSEEASVEKPFWFMVGGHEMTSGKTFAELYALTGNIDFSEDSLNAFRASVDAYGKAEVPTRVAEVYWQIAQVHDRLGEYSESAKNFESASQNYTVAAAKIPQLGDFYADYALYMRSWREIEKAKNAHKQEEYHSAKEHYEEAAELHNSTSRWKHLSLNYSAWARLNEAEDKSREERADEAKPLFHQAVKLFAEAKHSVEAKLDTNETKDMPAEDEKELLVNLAKASEARRKYCLGRIDLEEAKILDRQGDHAAGAEKYGSAAEEFHKLSDTMSNESDRNELVLIAYLCEAWQMMARAEAEASPHLYLEASRLFEEAKEKSSTERAKLLALGHSRFCLSLEAGSRFEDARDVEIYSAAKKHIEAAENYYLKASYTNASEYAKATYLLLDAYMFTHQAETETDPSKKPVYYHMAEKLLQSSASSYAKASQLRKSDLVGRLLENVKEKRQLAMSLTELLYAPTITSTTTSLPAPSPTQEQPVGLERFEHADVQANLVFGAKETTVGDDMDFEIELVNAGKAPASLMRVEGIAPVSFEIKQVPEIYRIEDSCLNMKGRRLNPLATETVKIILRPMNRGMFTIKPRVLYADETGGERLCESEPLMVSVKELGIKGWLKGER